MFEIWVFIVALATHEFIRFLLLNFYNYKPNILPFIGQNIWRKMSLKHLLIISVASYLVGLFISSINTIAIMGYFIATSVELVIIIKIINIGIQGKDLNIYTLNSFEKYVERDRFWKR